MEVITKNNVTARGKQSILLVMDEEDREYFFDAIVKDILSLANCAIYYVKSRENVDIGGFVAGIVIVSESLIKNKKDVWNIYNKLISNHIPVIPIAVQAGIKNMFSKEFGKQHCIIKDNKSNHDRYYKELRNHLKSIIISDKTLDEIKAAFDCHVFLSYRKNDAEKAKQVIKFLRQCKKLDEAAIWYDDYLIPGDNYETEIEEEIKNCSFFVLVVTRNVLEKSKNAINNELQDNYVLRVEYPLALKYKKPIIPIMVDAIDRDVLLKNFKNIGDIIPCGKKFELEQKMKQIDINSKNNKNSSYSHYLRGIAFLDGIFTETDTKKGIKIIKQEADKGQKDAIVKLAQMYYEGNHVAKNRQYAACYYKKLIDEVEKSGSIRDYPYCYNNYANASILDTPFNRNYKEPIRIFENGLNILRENKSDDSEYLFYYALTLASYQKMLFQGLYDEELVNCKEWQQKQDEAFKESISILDKLLIKDEFEENYMRLKATLEKEKAENASYPESQYLYQKMSSEKEQDKNGIGILEIEEMYSNAINDMKILYELNPLENEEDYIQLLYQASLRLCVDGDRNKVNEWIDECLEVCKKTVDGSEDDILNQRIGFYKINITFVRDYISMDLLNFVNKYNEYIYKDKAFTDSDIRKLLFAIEANYLNQNNDIKNDVYDAIKQTLLSPCSNKIRKDEHFLYVLLNLEYAYKGNIELESIKPNEYFKACGSFYASLEQRCNLADRMINIAKELCVKGFGYDSALNCLKSALEILTEIAKKNKCYIGDYKVALNMKDNLEKLLPMLKENPKLRLFFDTDAIVYIE